MERNREKIEYKQIALLLTASITVALSLLYGAMANTPALASTTPEDTAVPAQNDADWPMAAANPQRTSWTPEEVRGKLEPVWYRPIEPYISPKTQIIASNDLLYISTARGLYALHTGTGTSGEAGEVAWVYPTELPLGHSPTIYNGVAYVGGFDHKLHAIDALTGQGLWTFEAEAGFQTNPLVVDGIVYVGNRDGYMYAIYGHGHPNQGTLAWKYETEGPILFSAAYQDNTIYFAANDAHAYALNAQTGQLIWKSAKLPGSGFHSWWPVVHQDTVIFAGSQNYRTALDPGPAHDIQGLERDDLYPGWEDWQEDHLLGTRDPTPPYLVDAEPILQYHEQKPWRRTYLVLNRNTGQEVTYDFDNDGQAEYAPITWFNTHGTGNRYPPLVGVDGRLYQPMHYVKDVDTPIPRGHIVGWELGSRSFTTPSAISNAVDEPLAYAAGGNVIYWSRHRDCAAGAFDYTIPNPNPGTGFGSSGDRQWHYWSRCLELRDEIIPEYIEMYHVLSDYPSVALYRGDSNSVNGVYERHGDQNPPIPYKGRLYIHRSNAIIALGDHDGPITGLPSVPQVKAEDAEIRPVSTEELRQKLSTEVQKILDAGHLRPGYLSHGLFDQRTNGIVGEHLIDYWHTPSDTLYVLLLALPHLPAGQQEAVKSYLQSEYAAYPPHVYTHIGWSDGAPREVFDLPPEVESARDDFPPTSKWYSYYEGWHFPPHMFYALWKYAEVFGGAQEILNNSKDRLQAPPSNEYLAKWPQVHNAYIAGYWGYLELEELAGYPESADIRAELNRLLALRTATFDKDNPWVDCQEPDCNEYARALNVARNFMYLVPELAQHLRDNVLTDVQEAIDEYEYVAPYWFVTKTEHMYSEGIVNPLYDNSALFQARALILRETREDLLKYLDVPAFARGDLFYIQNLITTLEAAYSMEMEAAPSKGYQGDSITYTLTFFSSSSTLTLVNTLPAGVSAPSDFELEGTSVVPSYNSEQHRLTWSDAPPAGQKVIIRYAVTITTDSSQVLINTAELEESGMQPSLATALVMANPYRLYLPLACNGN